MGREGVGRDPIGCTPETLRTWVRRSEVDTGRLDGMTSEDGARLKALDRENKALRRTNEMLNTASAFFAQAEKVYGGRNVGLPLNRGALPVTRCSVARQMKAMGIEGVKRGRRTVTTRPDEAMERPRDAVKRPFKARRANALWVAGLTYVASWRGFVYVAFVIDAFAWRIVGWRVSHLRIPRDPGQ